MNQQKEKIDLTNKTIIFFDGVSNLCEKFVHFIIKRDAKKQFLFVAIQSDKAKELLNLFDKTNDDVTSIILFDNYIIYSKSSAVLRIICRLTGGWFLLYPLLLIPKFIRDLIYQFIAKQRYQWFGKQNRCWSPSKELEDRFLS